MKWIGQNIQDYISRFRNDVYIEGGELTSYNPTNDGNPTISIGKDASDRLEIIAEYHSGAQTLNWAKFTTYTSSGSGNAGRFGFYVDEVIKFQIYDAGINISSSNALQIGGVDILTDSSGTTTLNNIDALDGTTIATIETAMEANLDTLDSVTSMTSLATLAALTSIGSAGATLTTTSYSVLDVDRTAAHGQAGAEDITALHIDFDREAPEVGTHAHNDIGIDLDVNSRSLGTSSLIGMDIDVRGGTGGTSTAYGINLGVSGADTNIGMDITTLGTHLRLFNNAADYATFTVADTGDLTIATVGDGTTDSDIDINADGRILLNPADGSQVNIYNNVASSATEGAKLNLIADDSAAMGDDHRLGRLAFFGAEDGASTLRRGASIEAFADATWNASVNDTRLEFYTMDGDNGVELSLTLDSDLLATFAGAVTVTGALTGTLATATQPNIESIGTDGDTLTILADQLLMSNTTADTPVVKLLNTTDDDQAGQLVFEKLRDDDAVGSGQNLGEIWFKGQDNGQNTQDYAYIVGEIDVSTGGQESGQLILGVANHDGGNGNGLILTGGSEDTEIDVTVGLGANSVVTIPGDIDLAGDIDVDGTLETDALTVGGVAFTPSTTKQMTHHVFVDDMDTTKHYIGLTEADAENTSTSNKFIPFPAGVDGKLLKVFLRSNKDLTGHTLTWRLETVAAANVASATPNIIGTQTGVGCDNTTMTTYDFTGVSSNAFAASNLVFLSLQSNTDFGSNVVYYITCLWEWDLS